LGGHQQSQHQEGLDDAVVLVVAWAFDASGPVSASPAMPIRTASRQT
jgi:hypothetical protein